jgi:LysR family transcriptional regulator, hydrogen peroxide-inducible genes activator
VEIHQLRYFVAVVELGSFTKAAQRCGVSQPSLSQQMQKLERELGHPLLDRLGRKIRLTEAGQAFYERSTAILDAVDEAKACVRDGEDWRTGTVTIGAIHTVAPYLLPDVVQQFTRRFPQAQVCVEERLTEMLLERCLAGDLDVGIVALPIAEKRVRVEPLFKEELLAAIPKSSPLATRKRIALADVTSEPFLLLDEMHCFGRQTLKLCTDNDCVPAISCRTAQLLTVQEMVALGQGVSLVPEMASRRDRDRRCVYRSLTGPPVEREIAMIWRPRYHPRKLVQALVELLREIGRQHADRTRPFPIDDRATRRAARVPAISRPR